MLFWDQTLAELFLKGSFVMIPLLICCVLGATIIVERGIYYMRLRFSYEKFSKGLRSMLQKENGFREAIVYSRKKGNPISRLAEMYILHVQNDGLREEILNREGSLALEKMEAHLRTLAAITHLAPLLGLLGTVTGLVTAFHQIEIVGGQVQASQLAGGIWEALITTVFGLVIAIPCMAAYHGYESHVDRVSRRMQFIVTDLDEYFGKTTGPKRNERVAYGDESVLNTVRE